MNSNMSDVIRNSLATKTATKATKAAKATKATKVTTTQPRTKPELAYTVYYSDGRVSAGARTSTFTLEELQEFVGGRIEILPAFASRSYVVNEEGLLQNLPVNPSVPQFRGNVVLVSSALLR